MQQIVKLKIKKIAELGHQTVLAYNCRNVYLTWFQKLAFQSMTRAEGTKLHWAADVCGVI